MTEPRREPSTRPWGTGSSGRAAVCVVLLVGDLVLTWLWGSAAQSGFEATRPRLGWVLAVAAASAAVGAVCLALLVWVSVRLRRAETQRTPAAGLQRGTTWVTGLAILRLALFFVAMVVLGAFTDLQGQLVLALGLLEAAVVLWLCVSTARAVVRTTQRAD